MTRRAQRRRESAIESLLGSLPPLCVVVGKGGVGKTTCAVGVAAHLAARGERTMLLSTDPAGALASVLDTPLVPDEPRDVAEIAGLVARQLDARRARRNFLGRWRETIVAILDRGTYLDAVDIEGFVDATFPGSDEIFAVLTLAELVARRTRGRFPDGGAGSRRLVVDTAPTGHTLRLLALPETFDAVVALLESMQAKHRFMVSALTRRYRPDRADEFLDEMRTTMGTLRAALADRELASALLVARPEPVVVAETARYAEALRGMRLGIAAVIVNDVARSDDAATEWSRRALRDIAEDVACVELPRMDPPPRGVREIAGLLDALRVVRTDEREGMMRQAGEGSRAARSPSPSLLLGGAPRSTESDDDAGAAGRPRLLPLLRTLTITGGKGGVGKSTVSCALAIAAADASAHRPTLLVSADPAPSIADALAVDDPHWARDRPEAVEGVDGLFAWQMDASRAFAQLRDRYRERIDAVFDALVGRGVNVPHDRAILRDLLALAPPGIDELSALASLGETLAEQRYACIVVDAAPTGHLLRLLEMPPLALDWTHRLMRLMLKYKDLAGLGDAAQELMAFSRRTRALDALLRDPEQCGIVLVTLDEPIVRGESIRLAETLRASRLTILGVVENRAAAGRDTSGYDSIPVLRAPVSAAPLVGAAAIRRWTASWGPLVHGRLDRG